MDISRLLRETQAREHRQKHREQAPSTHLNDYTQDPTLLIITVIIEQESHSHARINRSPAPRWIDRKFNRINLTSAESLCDNYGLP